MKERFENIFLIISIFILSFFFMCLFSCSAEEIDNDTLWTKEKTEVMQQQTRTEVQDTTHIHYTLKSEWAKLIDKCINAALQCDVIYIDLLNHDVNLVNYIEDPRHSWCYECKIKALKFAYNHKIWGDTMAEIDEGIALEELIENDKDFLNIWNGI